MEYSLLGKSSLRISRIGFGCMSLDPSGDDPQQILHQAMDHQINYFDTADIYRQGLNEEMLGKAIRGRRSELVIASKVGNVQRADGSGLDWNASREHILASVETTLRRLGTDHLDLYQLHGGTMDDPIDETIDAFDTLVKQGKIRYYGISSIRPNVIREWVSRSSMVSVMMQYNLLDRRPEETVFPLLAQHGIGVLARGTLASGLLTGREPGEYLGYTEEQVARAAAVIRTLSGPHRSPAQTAMAFALSHPAVNSAVVGIRTFAQLRDAASYAQSAPLLFTEQTTLRSLLDNNLYTVHR